eukprot:4222193-Pleurochrysis_carterae.AAC.1
MATDHCTHGSEHPRHRRPLAGRRSLRSRLAAIRSHSVCVMPTFMLLLPKDAIGAFYCDVCTCSAIQRAWMQAISPCKPRLLFNCAQSAVIFTAGALYSGLLYFRLFAAAPSSRFLSDVAAVAYGKLGR